MEKPAEQVVDQILVMDAQIGRLKAFEVLVRRWQKRLWWQAYNMTGDSQAAWDITQESWLSIVRGIARLTDPAKFGPWAYRIVTHKASDWIRRKGKEPLLEPEEEPKDSVAFEPPGDTTVSDVHSILRLLPASCRIVLNLYYIEGFRLAEISQILGTAEGTVKSRLHTARAEFRTLWERLSNTAQAGTILNRKGTRNERGPDQENSG